jgi:hypothetical protein
LPGAEAGAWPEITLPEITLPEITLPEITLPEITLPEITLRVSFCKAVVRKVEPWPTLARGISS